MDIRTRALVVCATILASAFVGAPAEAATAVRACQGIFQNRHLGYTHRTDLHPSYHYEGVSAYMTPRPSGVCTGQGGFGNFSGASIMIAEINTGGNYWAQVGYERNGAYTGYRWFSQFMNNTGAPETWYSPNPQTSQLGIQHTFRVLWQPSCDCFRAYIDSTVVDQSSFNPFFTWPTFQPWSPQFFAETGWLESDVPGTPGSPLPFRSLGAQRVTDDVVENMPCTMTSFNDNPARWGQSSSNCQNFTVWTAVP
jgi:hypothetical protein